MKTENVNHRKFTVISIIYENDDFAVAFGEWEEKELVIGMRWTGGNDDKNIGYPKTFGNPVWFLLHEKLNSPFLKSLLLSPSSKNEKIIEAFERLTKGESK